jgi:hypothetical protein
LQSLGRGLEKFVYDCTTAGRSTLAEYIKSNKTGRLHVHNSCRKSLAAVKVDKATTAPGTSKLKTRSTCGNFLFKQMCFYCGDKMEG